MGLTCFVAYSVFMLMVAEKVPATSEIVPIISIYLTIVMSFTSISVMMAVFVTNIHEKTKTCTTKAHRVPRIIRHLCMNHLAKFLGMKSSSKRIFKIVLKSFRKAAEIDNSRRGRKYIERATIDEAKASRDESTEFHRNALEFLRRQRQRERDMSWLCHDKNGGVGSLSHHQHGSSFRMNTGSSSNQIHSLNRRRQSSSECGDSSTEVSRYDGSSSSSSDENDDDKSKRSSKRREQSPIWKQNIYITNLDDDDNDENEVRLRRGRFKSMTSSDNSDDDDDDDDDGGFRQSLKPNSSKKKQQQQQQQQQKQKQQRRKTKNEQVLKDKAKNSKLKLRKDFMPIYLSYEWVLIGLVLDRLFFWLYTTSVFVSYVATLYIFPFLVQSNYRDDLYYTNVP